MHTNFINGQIKIMVKVLCLSGIFHKIIIGKDGKIFDTFSSMTKPTSGKFVKVIEEALNK